MNPESPEKAALAIAPEGVISPKRGFCERVNLDPYHKSEGPSVRYHTHRSASRRRRQETASQQRAVRAPRIAVLLPPMCLSPSVRPAQSATMRNLRQRRPSTLQAGEPCRPRPDSDRRCDRREGGSDPIRSSRGTGNRRGTHRRASGRRVSRRIGRDGRRQRPRKVRIARPSGRSSSSASLESRHATCKTTE